MKQMQQVQADAQRIQEEMAGTVVEGTAGGGSIRIALTGAYDIKEIKIAPEILETQDAELLEDMVKAALEDVLGRISAMNREAMSKALGGAQIPGML